MDLLLGSGLDPSLGLPYLDLDSVEPGQAGEPWPAVSPDAPAYVLFTSGYTHHPGLEAGSDCDEGPPDAVVDTPFLAKPYGREALLAKVRQVLDSPAASQEQSPGA